MVALAPVSKRGAAVSPWIAAGRLARFSRTACFAYGGYWFGGHISDVRSAGGGTIEYLSGWLWPLPVELAFVLSPVYCLTRFAAWSGGWPHGRGGRLVQVPRLLAPWPPTAKTAPGGGPVASCYDTRHYILTLQEVQAMARGSGGSGYDLNFSRHRYMEVPADEGMVLQDRVADISSERNAVFAERLSEAVARCDRVETASLTGWRAEEVHQRNGRLLEDLASGTTDPHCTWMSDRRLSGGR